MTDDRYPVTTGLQAWTAAMLAQLEAARDQLHPVEYEALTDCIAIAVARECARALTTARGLGRAA